MQSQRVDELAITLQNNNMNLETRQAWRCVTPYPSRRSPSDRLTCGRQFKLNLSDEHFEEPDNIQARAAPWSGLDPPKPEAQAEIARRMIRPQSPFAILMTRVMSISRSMLVPSDLAFDPKSVRGIARPILGLS